MKRRRAKSFVRLSTLLFLPVWIMALVACSLESLSGHCGGHPSEASEHADAEHADSHAGHDHDSPPAPAKAPHSGEFCAALASTVFTSTTIAIAPLNLDSITIAVAPAVLAPSAENFNFRVFSRQAKRAIWVFTPEVCLGPALHSQAPPHFG